VHAVSPDLIPNARRDYFTENETFKVFEKKLKEKFKELHELYHFSSQLRSEKKRIEKVGILVEEYAKKSEKGFTKPKEQKEYEEKIQKAKKEAEKAKEKIEKLKEKAKIDNAKSKITDRITKDINDKLPKNAIPQNNNEKPKLLTDNLSKRNRSERKLIGKILSIIDNVLPKDLSEIVKQKIIEELNK